MSIFNVDGWDLPTKIAVATSKEKQIKDAKKAARKAFAEEQKKIRKEAAETQEESDEEEIPEPPKKRRLSVDEDGFTKVKKSKKSRTERTEDTNDKEAEAKIEAPTNEQDAKKDKKSKKNKEKKSDDTKEKVEEKPAAPTSSMAKAFQKTKLTPLQQKMMEKLAGSRFRWINEQLYTTRSEEAVKLIEEHPEMFDEYHTGFRSQVQGWPENPVDALVEQVRFRMLKPIGAPGGMPGERDGTISIADMGCGEAMFALKLVNYQKEREQDEKRKLRKNPRARTSKLPKFDVHSFDLKKANDRVTVADIKNVPLADESVNVVVFCLALMGTNFLDFVKEAIRILKPNGEIWIAEIKSRFSENNTIEFVKVLKSLGLFHKSTDENNKMFVRLEFFKPNKQYLEDRDQKEKVRKSKRRTFEEHDAEEESVDKRREREPEGKWLLKPCIYKRR